MGQNKKLLVIGLDGATLDLLEPWIDKGELPTLMKFEREGVIGHLNSVFPPVTPPAWASFITGKNPGKHGIFDCLIRKENSYERDYAIGAHIKSKAFWDYLDDAGKTVGVLRIPIVYPATKVNGFMITGVLSPLQESESYPPELIGELKSKISDYRDTMRVHNGEDEYIEDLMYTTQKHAEEALYLLNNKEWDFFMATFFYGDQIQHFFWKHMDPRHPLHDHKKSKKYKNAILNYYKLIDDVLKTILENIDNNVDIMIMSDHGFGPVYREVYINTWLANNDLLSLKQKNNSVEKYINREKIGHILSKLGLRKLIKLIPRQLAEKIPSGRPSISDVDWSKTKAYSIGFSGQIFINLKDKEPEGIVEPGEAYEKLRDEIMSRLRELKDLDTGETLVDVILKREEVYSGPYAEQAADILFSIKGMKYTTNNFSWDNKITCLTDNGASGTHRFNGVFMAMGPSFKQGVRINAEIVDLAPTILHMYGIPIPSDMDGKVLTNIFNEKSLNTEIKKYETSPDTDKAISTILSEDAKNKIKERLKELGYL